MTTITIKTADLTGAALDWAVALASGVAVNIIPPNKYPNLVRCADSLGKNFHPSTNWAQAGPIVEREQISTDHLHGRAEQFRWLALILGRDKNGFAEMKSCYGPTLLTTAMRCYVKHKLGDSADIPQELMS